MALLFNLIRSSLCNNWKNSVQKKLMSTKLFKKSSIVWMDLEMTGLNVKKDKILEVSCLITDKDLNIVAEAPCFIIHQNESTLSSMNDWCKKNHAETGLIEASRNSKINIEDAENQLLQFLEMNVPKNACPLAGNTVYMDRLFLLEYMPQITEYLHYRIIDVSSIKEICKRWNPRVFSNAPEKILKHRSLEDIKESIEELKYYKENFTIST